MPKTETNHAIENAKAHIENMREIFAGIAALEDEEGPESVMIDHEAFPDADALRERIQEIPLSVMVRSDWQDPNECLNAAEFEILLSTGGPALRICGDLDEHRQPTRACMQWQDWGTPWTDYFEPGCGDTLLEFASHFYFGEG